MQNFIYWDDFIELWIKLNQRGLKFILSKLSLFQKNRTISSFQYQFEHANWWIIPLIKNRQNTIISGHPNTDYETYISGRYLKNEEAQILVSLGCGVGSHEIKLAQLNKNLKIIGYDIAKDLISNAQRLAHQQDLHSINFKVEDVYSIKYEEESVDYFLFNAALHHFRDIDNFITKTIYPALKKGGLIIINEFVGPNRMNFSKEQMRFCDKCLDEIISPENKRILNTPLTKTRCYRLGKLRMWVSDPSECVDSESILPILQKHFKTLELKNLGGNVLMPVLKHIAHHFTHNHQEELQKLIEREDLYIKDNSSDFVFGVFQKD